MINENSVWQKRGKKEKRLHLLVQPLRLAWILWTQCESKHQIGFLTAWVGGQTGEDGNGE